MKQGSQADLSTAQIGIIGCLPKADYPIEPPNQPGCLLENCPACKREMWVSEKKRQLRIEYPKLIAMCMRCAVVAMKMLEDDDGDEAVHVDLSKIKPKK